MNVSLRYCGERCFAVSYRGITFYLEPSAAAGAVTDADMLVSSGAVSLGSDADLAAIKAMLDAGTRSKLILPKAAGELANARGLDYHRMTTTDAALRVEYFKNGEYGRVYGVPAARFDENGCPQLDWTPIGGFPQIGFMARFGATTVWHSGLGVPYRELADRLMPYAVNVGIITIGDGAFTESEAADLAETVGMPWLVPAPLSAAAANRFVEHMLGSRPSQRFKLFQPGETWTIPGS